MKRKKFLAILMTCLVVTSTTGCTVILPWETEAKKEQDKQNAVEDLESLIEGTEAYFFDDSIKSTSSAKWTKGIAQLGGTDIHVPCSIDDLKSAGFTIVDSMSKKEIDKATKLQDTIISKDDASVMASLSKDGQIFMLNADKDNNGLLIDGVKVGDKFEDAAVNLGEPYYAGKIDDIEERYIFQSESGFEVTLVVDMETQKVKGWSLYNYDILSKILQEGYKKASEKASEKSEPKKKEKTADPSSSK